LTVKIKLYCSMIYVYAKELGRIVFWNSFTMML